MTRPRFVLPVLAVLLAVPAVLRADTLNRVVLRINDQIATLYDWQQRRENMVRELMRAQEISAEDRARFLAQAGEMAYKDLFEELLIESRAGQLGVEVAKSDIDKQLDQMKQGFGIQTDEDFQQALAQSGLTEEQLRERIRRDLRAREVMGREVQSRVKIDEDDLRRIYQRDHEQFRLPEQLQLREVVVLEENGLPTADERAALAARIEQAVAGGKSLADAVAEPAAQGQTSNVIDLGWVAPGDLDPSLETVVFKLPAGTLSDPLPGRGGLHLVQVVDRHESRIPAFTEVQEQIRVREQRRKMQDEISKYMAELEKKSLVVTQPPPEAEGFRELMGTRPLSKDEELGLVPVQGAVGAVGAAGAAPKTPEVKVPAGGQPQPLPEPKPVTNEPPPPV